MKVKLELSSSDSHLLEQTITRIVTFGNTLGIKTVAKIKRNQKIRFKQAYFGYRIVLKTANPDAIRGLTAIKIPDAVHLSVKSVNIPS